MSEKVKYDKWNNTINKINNIHHKLSVISRPYHAPYALIKILNAPGLFEASTKDFSQTLIGIK